MSSQRHRQLVRNYGANCTPIAEKQPSLGYLRQIPGPFAVKFGPAGGPLQGSSLMGPPPVAIPAPGIFEHPLAAAVVIAGALSGMTPPDAGGTAPSEPPAARTFPIGPVNLASVEDDPNGILLTTVGPIDVQAGDMVTIEATGSTPMNGSYQVVSVNPLVIDNMAELAAPIANKGRITVTGGA